MRLPFVALAGALVLTSSPALQAASLVGKVIDPMTGFPVAGATLTAGPGLETTTDLSGQFTLNGLEGTLQISVRKEGYRPTTLSALVLTGDQVQKLEIPLESAAGDIVKLETVEVTAAAAEQSDLGLLLSRQKSASLSDAIGSDQFSKLAIGNAADAMTKVTGASLVGGKYVFIRGLGDRYANTLMNGVSVPSADPDKRAVQMDQFPADLIESIVTEKSFTPDQPGNFSGGSVNLRTKSYPDYGFLSVSASSSFRDGTTGEELLYLPNSGSELPQLPATIPSRTQAELEARRGNLTPAATLDAASRAFGTASYFPGTRKDQPDFGLSATFGDRRALGEEGILGYTASVTYDRSAQHSTDGEANRYLGTPNEVQGRLVLTSDPSVLSYNGASVASTTPPLGVTRSSHYETYGAFAKLALRPVEDHELTFDFFLTHNVDDTLRRGVGEEQQNYSGAVYEVYDLLYTERNVQSALLSGKSLFPAANELEINWKVSRSRSTQDQPDYRSLAVVYNPDGSFINATGVQPNRFFRDLEEDGTEYSADITYPFTFAGRTHRVKAGTVQSRNERSYVERRFQYALAPRSRSQLLNFPNPVGIQSTTATSVTFGNTVSRLEEPNNYDGTQDVQAVYAMIDTTPLKQLRMVTGVRSESTEILTEPVKLPASGARDGLIDTRKALPSFSLIYTPVKKQNFRFAYGRTLARPTYKELSDVRFEDVFTGDVYVGNPDLRLTVIDNFDLRWELYPEKGAILAVGAFAKRLDSPIEVLY